MEAEPSSAEPDFPQTSTRESDSVILDDTGTPKNEHAVQGSGPESDTAPVPRTMSSQGVCATESEEEAPGTVREECTENGGDATLNAEATAVNAPPQLPDSSLSDQLANENERLKSELQKLQRELDEAKSEVREKLGPVS
jgi:hypothetical protein